MHCYYDKDGGREDGSLFIPKLKQTKDVLN